MDKLVRKMFLLALVAVMSLSMVSCGLFGSKDDAESGTGQAAAEDADTADEEDPTTKDYDNGIYFDEEDEEYTLKTKKVLPTKFIGKWEATSGQALYQYGNVDLDVKDNQTWTGNIADDDLKGKWEEEGDGIYLTSEFFNCHLYFTDKDVLVMQYQPDENEEDYITTVLTKKK